MASEALEKVALTSQNKSNESAYKLFLDMDETSRLKLLNLIVIIDKYPNIIEIADKSKMMIGVTILPEYLEQFYERLEGWWFDRVIRHLNSPRDYVLNYALIQNKASDIRDQFSADNLPNDFPVAIQNIDINSLSADMRIFIEQLELIGIGTGNKQIAASDFKRAKKQRLRWLRDSLIDHEELEIYESRLCDEWLRKFNDMCEDINDDVDSDYKIYGKGLYRKTQESSKLRIRENFEDPFITRGSYHLLANELRVGWHKEFNNLLTYLIEEV